jgi:hypothetical protein
VTALLVAIGHERIGGGRGVIGRWRVTPEAPARLLAFDAELVAREERGERRDSWGFRPAQVFAFARLLSGVGEKLANPLSR